MERALAFLRAQRDPRQARHDDNAFNYVKNRSLRELLADRAISHLTTQPYRPRSNGKVERFHQTMAREWAYGLIYAHIDTAPKRCHQRPHSAIGDRPPISRVHNLLGRNLARREPHLDAGAAVAGSPVMPTQSAACRMIDEPRPGARPPIPLPASLMITTRPVSMIRAFNVKASPAAAGAYA